MSSKTSEMGGQKSLSENGGLGGTKTPFQNGAFEALLTPELLFKMNKKIAQLTKVVYGLNTRGEELEGQLQSSKEAEDKARSQNLDLQHRMTSFKAKIESEMGKLRDLEAQAKQAQMWKMECENLQRRLETEGCPDGSSGAALSHAREEAETGRRREAALQYELDQARHAINNLKAHHDFIMRERDTQQMMESEKIVLEWQTRMAEMEARYKVQTRHLSDDLEVSHSECEMLRGRVLRATPASSSTAADEVVLRDQVRMMQLKHDSDRRDWEMKMKRQADDIEEERLKLTDEKLDMMRRVRSQTEERENQKEDLEDQLRATTEAYEERLRDLRASQSLLQRLLDDKEADFEVTLKTKVVEWKSEWDLAEEGLKEEIRNLKNENLKLKAEVTGLNFSLDNEGLTFVGRIQKLEDELIEKTKEGELKSKTYRTKLDTLERENNQYLSEKQELESFVIEERERTKVKLKNQEIMNDKGKLTLHNKCQQAKETERVLREEIKTLEEGNDVGRREKEDLERRLRNSERDWQDRLSRDVRATEVRVKQRVDRTWIEKLKKTEESASCDLERIKEARNRREMSLKREIEVAQNSEEETKNLNEEIKQKVKILRETDVERTKLMRRLEDEVKSLKRTEDEADRRREKELRAQESRYQKQIDDLTLSLSSKQQEVTDLAEELAEAREMTSSSPSELDLLIQIEDMKKQVKLNENMAESIKVELGYTRNETEIVKMKLESLDGELSLSKEQVTSLQEQNDNKSRDIFRLKDEEGKMRTLEEKVKSLEDQLRKSEVTRTDLQDNLNESEAERDEELKIVQDALDEAAQEREDLIHSFQKELQQLNATNAAREHQMLDDFEWKLREMQKDHKNKMIDKDKQIQSTLQRVKSQADDEDVRQKMEKMKNEINAKWEDKLRSECSRLKAELDELHSEEKHLAVESTKVQKKQEIQSLKASWELSQEEMTKEISSLKDSLTEKDAYYHKELESLRTTTDRDIWDLRMKLQKMNETSYDKQQMMEEKHRDQMERFRVDSEDRIRQLESRLAAREAEAGIDLMAQLEKKHKEQMAHLEEHHHVNMERLRDELECDKLDAIETARLMISRKREDVEENLKGQIATHEEDIRQCRDETELLRESLSRRDETVRSLREELERHQDAPRGYSVQADHAHNSSATPPTVFDHAPGSALNSSQFSLASSSSDSQGSRTSQDRYYLPENTGVLDEDQRTGNNTGLLGKVFGGGWFAPTKGRRGSTPLSNKKPYGT